MTDARQQHPVIAAGVAGLAGLYRRGDSDPLAVTRFYLDRIAALDGTVGAYNQVLAEQAMVDASASAARRRAGKPLSEIDGAPIAVKANIAVAGAFWHAGIGAYRTRIAQQDADCVARLRAAGAVILGVANMHEGALGATTDNVWFGRTQNPLRDGYTAGGSSGGSAAAVAAGLAAAALGSDTMGSVRIPSAYCGLAGYKPARHVISLDGVIPLSTSLDHVGVHGWTVIDCALIAAHAGAGAATSPSLQGLRLAVPNWRARVEAPDFIWKARDEAATLLLLAGMQRVSADLDAYQSGQARRLGLLVSEVEGLNAHEAQLARSEDGFSPEFLGLLRWGGRQPATRIAAAYQGLDAIRCAGMAWLEQVDAVLLPTAPQTAFPFGQPVPANQADFTALADFIGCPAVAVPFGRSPDGLPLSVQVIGKDPSIVLGVAASLG
ncbi:amidase [Niveispirillum sp. KHB5.9]|uniref:amidase n=1 Tax=Niveispirillum sp. KHB5.9 TaxID=3400269 RepID=UPI003A84E0C0